MNYTIRSKHIRETAFIFQLNNVFNRKYEPNGYTYSYFYGGQLITENFLFPWPEPISCLPSISNYKAGAICTGPDYDLMVQQIIIPTQPLQKMSFRGRIVNMILRGSNVF
jgi:hypothetical protein